METSQTPQTSSPPPSSCFTCHKLQSEFPHPLKRCAKCKGTLYCSRECQKTDWKKHKAICASQASSTAAKSATPSQGTAPPNQPTPGGQHNPGFRVVNQLLGLANDDYLHKFPEKEAFAQIIDCFRMRVEDEYVFRGNTVGLYNEEDPRREFNKFLDLAESRLGLLPPWWNAEKRRECMRMAVDGSQWSDINSAVEKHDIQDHYKVSTMPMLLRVLGEKIYGKGFM